MQQSLGITFIYITHDQEEALGMSDRVALMRLGRFVQLGTPEELYERPQTAFAASFIGETNLLRGTAAAVKDDGVLMDIGGINVPCDTDLWVSPGEDLCLSIRAERLYMSPVPTKEPCQLSGILDGQPLCRGRAGLHAEAAGRTNPQQPPPHRGEIPCQIGDKVYCYWHQESAVLVEDDLGEMS